MKATKCTTGDAGGKVKKVKFEKELSFLDVHIVQQRPQLSNLPDNDEETIDTISVDDTTSVSVSPVPDSPCTETPSEPSTSGSSTKQQSRKKQQKQSYSNVMEQYFQCKSQHLQNKSTSKKEDDHIAKFFRSIEETVRTLPVHLQIQAKTKISTFVHQLEAEAVQMSQPNTFTFQSHEYSQRYRPYNTNQFINQQTLQNPVENPMQNPWTAWSSQQHPDVQSNSSNTSSKEN